MQNLHEVFSKAESVKQQLIKIYSIEFEEAKKAEVMKAVFDESIFF